MRKLAILFCLGLASCEYHNAESIVEPAHLVGFWVSENVSINGVNSTEYLDGLNDGFHLAIREDHSFSRNYHQGQWELNQYQFVLKADISAGGVRWNTTILELSHDKLVLEFSVTENQYCCDFDAFSNSEIITIRETFRRLD